MSKLEIFFAKARANPKRVVFPEIEDARVAAAVSRLKDDCLCVPVGLSKPSDAQMAALVDGRGVKEAIARRMLQNRCIAAGPWSQRAKRMLWLPAPTAPRVA